ncbi:MarR family transcriptional regulator [Undibacterium sp. RTI2.1]|uniref:MarR family winged helix-turn-helix transcriptional regulator n=1 Tax=unclassified Undibacterium TaxID=2630295 RepID=UPI002AB58B3F|nr:MULTISPECIES: MarR family transcriptional regulator [unclassified Undibacterium]MDY7539041.1 MarR family transcriptional regulator [Undibacterium sp. 5I1]MEB0032438.1 MarR family transcriptional regulator [Undibacterium sp. RTI2.1]MEB0115881.1 MarR family transcriptional regulator [Undibacterium sp. RTI2.2]MEB0229825.1 MarR family transcriptional regulator [Undibacterium sp. 10I3]MEB0258270.1 MarR family transcriptional regulator [Undibacterium sp. 5I1]
MKSPAATTTDNANQTPQLGDQLCFALYSTSLAMSKLYRKLLKKLGITYSQYLVLMVLWEQDEQTVNDIGQKLVLDSATLTPLLKRMEAQELLTRVRAASDERQVIISLTKAGNDLRKAAADLPVSVLCATECSTDEVKNLKDQILALRASIMKTA